MHIELIGSTSAGKTTLAKQMVKAGRRSGIDISLSDDFMLQQLHLNWIEVDFLRRRLVEMVAFAFCLAHLARYKDFFGFVVHEGKSSPGSWLYRFNRIRNVVRKVGIFEFIARRRGAKQIVLADNEGILQGIHNLFVHQDSEADLRKISRYVELAPLPDVVLYLQQDEAVLVARTLGRGHARVTGDSPDRVVHFIRQAIAVFNEVILAPRIQDRLLIVDGGLNLRPEADDLCGLKFHRVTDLVRSGH